MSDPVETASKRAAARTASKSRRARQIERREAYLDLLASGYTHRQIATLARRSVYSVRRAIDQAIDEQRLDTPERFVRLQVARITKALRSADDLVERGDMRAVGAYLKLVGALDRYHGLDARHRRFLVETAPAAALPAAPLALSSPGRSSGPVGEEAPKVAEIGA